MSTGDESGRQDLYSSEGVGEDKDSSTSGAQDSLLYHSPLHPSNPLN